MPKGTKTYLKEAITCCDDRIAIFEGDKNPQIQELLIKAKSQREAFEVVLESLYGYHVGIKTFC